MNLTREPLLTRVIEPNELTCEPGSLYLHGQGPEERSALDEDWAASQVDVTFSEVDDCGDETINLLGRHVALRDRQGISDVLQLDGPLYLDITGMTYVTWAPILAAALGVNRVLRVIYREPVDYRRSENPTRGMIYDLSERIEGIAPLPGMASIRRRDPRASVLVPLLGFEGTRLSHIIENSDPDPERVIPIVGVPGFRPEFTTQALLGNRLVLAQEGYYSRVQFAKANCPFDLFHQLVRVQDTFGQAPLRVAPVGTKPHGLGAVLFALSRPSKAEIVYDHPIRTTSRTKGLSRVCVYDVSTFVQSPLFQEGLPHA